MKYSLATLGAAALLTMGLGLPNLAQANTSESSWTAASSLNQSEYDSDKKLQFNIGRCYSLFDLSSGKITVTFSLGDATPSENAVYSIKYAIGNEACSSKKLENETSDTCKNIKNNQALTAATKQIPVELNVDSLSSAKDAESCANLSESAYLYLIVNDPNAGGDNIYTVTYTLDFRTKRPESPSAPEVEVGGSSIKLSWDDVSGISKYNVYYEVSGEDSSLSDGAAPENVSAKSVQVAKSGVTLKDDIKENTSYVVGVTAIDEFGNESLLSGTTEATTVASKDFWESYREENADVDGGFCFIATAAWGSTQEPHVALLRQFRDDILKKSAPGRAFIDTYYRLSPPLAYFIGQHPTARAITRTMLWPLYGMAYLALNAPIALGGIFLVFCFGLALLIRRARKNRAVKKQTALSAATKSTTAAILLAAAALCAAPNNAYADPTDDSPVNMMFEIKGGMYTPDNLGNAFAEHFKDKNGFVVEAEYDWQFWRGVGSLGLGFHLAYGNISGHAVDDSGETTVDEEKLHWLPLRLSLIYRFDYLWQRFSFPITLYAKAGFDYYVYWNKGGDGEVSTDGEAKGYGGTFGFHVMAGLALVLDWFAPSMAKSFDVEWGVNNSYLFAEFVYANINNFYAGNAFDLTDKATFHVGIGIEF